MDFNVDAWETDAATERLNESLFESLNSAGRKPKKRKLKQANTGTLPVRNKKGTEGNGISSGDIKVVTENMTAKSSKQDKKGTVQNSKVKISDTCTSSVLSKIPKKSRRNKFKNPDWKHKCERQVKDVLSACSEEQGLKSATLSVVSKANRDTSQKKTGYKSPGVGNKRRPVKHKVKQEKPNLFKSVDTKSSRNDEVSVTDSSICIIKKKRKSADVEEHLVGDIDLCKRNTKQKKSLKKASESVQSEMSGEGSDSDVALEFDSEGSVCGSDILTDSDVDLSGSDSSSEEFESLLKQLKKIRNLDEDIGDGDSSKDHNQPVNFKEGKLKGNSKTSIGLPKNDTSKACKKYDSGIEYHEEHSSDSEEFLTPKVKTGGERQSLGVPERAEKERSSTSQGKSSLPFNVQKLKTLLGGAGTGDGSSSLKGDDSLVKSISDKGRNKKDKQKKDEVSSPESCEDGRSVKTKKLSLAERMKEQLNSARFRYLNEQLYRTTGSEAYKMMSSDPEAFKVYHEGFQSQVTKWPENPLKRVINYIKKRPKNLVIADFGCGDAQVARSVPNKVHSFDLVATNEFVTACDMSNVPLKRNSIDIAVFCLSLMGTNLTEFIMEANRVLKTGGILLVAEVRSRFDKMGTFLKKLEKLGLTIKQRDLSNKMFLWLELSKTEDSDESIAPNIELMPCVYKRR